MEAYRKYSNHLGGLIESAVSVSRRSARTAMKPPSKNASAELRRLISLDDLRASGAFFTNSKLSQFALHSILETVNENSIIFDPTCGAGDLLIAGASKLPTYENLSRTLTEWGKRLIGLDLHLEFTEVAKKRLVLAALGRGIDVAPTDLEITLDAFPKIQVGSINDRNELYRKATHILINPPYTMANAQPTCEWASGKVNGAAIFMESCVTNAKSNTEVAAILPDVLRSGSRYGKWRAVIQKYAKIKRVLTYGQFDEETDVDVFVLQLEIRREPLKQLCESADWSSAPTARISVSDKFDVFVGPVVDYREPHCGPWRPFVVSRGLPKWGFADNLPNRRFLGNSIRPPFVVVKRTSRPDDENRAIATIVRGMKPVAVENHLIVLKPKDKTLKTCHSLLENLKDRRTSKWLNQRIRCRHLTVSSLKELPWWE